MRWELDRAQEGTKINQKTKYMTSATGLIKCTDPDGEHMLACITREWMLETLKDKGKMNQYQPAVRQQANLQAAE